MFTEEMIKRPELIITLNPLCLFLKFTDQIKMVAAWKNEAAPAWKYVTVSKKLKTWMEILSDEWKFGEMNENLPSWMEICRCWAKKSLAEWKYVNLEQKNN